MKFGELFDISDKINRLIESVLEYFGKYYIMTIIFLHIIYVTIYFGILSINPSYVRLLSSIIQFFIGIFLVWRFHPYRDHILKQYDSKIIFGSGIFLLTNLGFFEVFTYYFSNTISSAVHLPL